MDNVKNFLSDLIGQNEVVLKYSGHYSEEIFKDIMYKVENIGSISNTAKRKIFFISVELLQNVHHHSLKDKFIDLPENYFHFAITKNNGKFFKICAGNFVNRKKYNTLVSKIEQLNLLNYDELRKLYKTVLNNNEYSDKGGGGLGMIDIKRKSELKLEHQNIFLNNNLYFFNFSVFLENKK